MTLRLPARHAAAAVQYVSCYYPDDQMSFVGFLGSEWLGGG